MINEVMKWLFYKTPDGTTYLQIIVVGILIILLINYFFKGLEEIRKCISEERKEKDENEV